MKITQQLTRLRWEGERPIQDDEGDDGMVDGGRGTMIHEGDNNNKEIIHGDRGAGWEDFMSDYWRLLPPPSTPLAAARGTATTREETDVRLCWVDPELNNKMLSANRQCWRAEPHPDGLHGPWHGP